MNSTKFEVLATGRMAEILAWEEGWVLKLFFDWFPEDAVRYEAELARSDIIMNGIEADVSNTNAALNELASHFLAAYKDHYLDRMPGARPN